VPIIENLVKGDASSPQRPRPQGGEGGFGGAEKPDPAIFGFALDVLGVDPGRVGYVGALRTHATILTMDPIFGEFAYGGVVTRNGRAAAVLVSHDEFESWKETTEIMADPEFRADALRGIGKTVSRINQLIERLGILRQKLTVEAVKLDLNSLVEQTLQDIAATPEVELEKELNPVPEVVADREQLHSVFTNLLLNARDAVMPKGRVIVRTGTLNGWAVVTVADNGCGMSPAFLRESLFRPFKTTKKNGLGIGMFQSKMIVEAHGGNIQVESETGAGTTFRVLLPLQMKGR
jgi:signal transduction histidine kinase